MIWLWIALGLLAVYIGGLWVVAWFSLHPPRIPIYLSPGGMGANQERVAVKGPAGNLDGWWCPVEGSRHACLLVHGYLMNKCELAPQAHRLWEMGVSCLLIDLRAHGQSQGSLCTLGHKEKEDVLAALRWIHERMPDARVTVIGSSMGAASAALALGEEPSLAHVLVLDSSFSKLSDAISGWREMFTFGALRALLAPTAIVSIPIAGFNPFRVDVARSLPRLGQMPVLLLHGDRDRLTPVSVARRNFEAILGPKHIVIFEGCVHSEARWMLPEQYMDALLAFLVEHGAIPAEFQMPTGEQAYKNRRDTEEQLRLSRGRSILDLTGDK
jgi:pimeloyl-ACP methyl ester carboxylesterase